MNYARSITLVFPMLPPTSNRIFFKGRQLTGEARTYAEAFSKYTTQHYLRELQQVNPEGIFAIHLRFFFDSLVNRTWNNMDIKPSKRADTRYKRIDLDNRIKLLTDCIRDAIDVDDCNFFAASQEKHQDPGKERVEIIVQEIDPSMFGVEEPDA